MNFVDFLSTIEVRVSRKDIGEGEIVNVDPPLTIFTNFENLMQGKSL